MNYLPRAAPPFISWPSFSRVLRTTKTLLVSVKKNIPFLVCHVICYFLCIAIFILKRKTLLRKIIHIGTLAFGAPTRGLGSSFCLRTAGQGLAQKELIFADTGTTRARVLRSMRACTSRPCVTRV